MNKRELLNEFGKVSGNIANPYVEEWKAGGGKVFGYNCSYFPEEIILAAGILPFRIRATGCKETTLADAYLSRANCSFVRAGLEHRLQGTYDFLDGAVFVYSCDHMCTGHNSWKAKGDLPLIEHIVSVPHTLTPYGQAWYREEIANIIDKVESHFNVEITDDRLKDAVSICNETRRLQIRLNELRSQEEPPITGSESLSVLVSGGAMPKEDYNQLLGSLIEILEKEEGVSGYSHRLMVCGSVIDDPALLEIMEDVGGLVVTDTLCFSGRGAVREPVGTEGDPLDAIAMSYYHQILCPRMFDSYPARIDFMIDAAKKADVDGVILQSIKNCDLHGVDNVMLERDFEKSGIPALMMEREYEALSDAGRIKTRVQAFLERIGG